MTPNERRVQRLYNSASHDIDCPSQFFMRPWSDLDAVERAWWTSVLKAAQKVT